MTSGGAGRDAGDDPPLYAALRSIYTTPPRHELREDRRVSSHEESFGTGRYGADDDPQGPPEPPLQPALFDLPPTTETTARLDPDSEAWPFGDWTDVSSSVEATDNAREGAVELIDPVTSRLVMCPCCGTVVAADRIRG